MSNVKYRRAEALCLVVMGGDSRSEDCEFKSQNRILDGNFSHLFVVKIVMSDVLLYSISVFVEAK